MGGSGESRSEGETPFFLVICLYIALFPSIFDTGLRYTFIWYYVAHLFCFVLCIVFLFIFEREREKKDVDVCVHVKLCMSSYVTLIAPNYHP